MIESVARKAVAAMPKLSCGKHVVRVEAEDSSGLAGSKQWSFKVAR